MIPDLAYFHPQIVHFVIALLFVGVIARVLSLLPLPAAFRFFGPAAFTLILIGSLATIPAVRSGEDAHGPAERVPGARDLVVHHEEAGERTRNVFLVVAAVELIALALYRRQRIAKALNAVSAVVGLAGLAVLYEAAEHGGEIVYNYAGNIGLRSGDPEHLRNSLVAALYHNAMHHRRAGRHDEAARLVNELVRQRPDDPEVQLVGAESVIRDQRNPRAAARILRTMTLPDSNTRLASRRTRLLREADSILADSGQAPR